ncbi:MAG: flagellar basal body P-ring protein FlgI, partial [Janthinobacterium lividum]
MRAAFRHWPGTRLIRLAIVVCAALMLAEAAAAAANAPVRVKDLGHLHGWRDNALFGTGIVTGLAGTGDSPFNRSTRQALSNVLARLNLGISPEQIQSRNVAVVMVSATLPSYARTGDTLDITVASAGDARSLVGGSLLLTSLAGVDGKVRALAQGPLSVGGYRYDANGNVVQKNHPTVGAVSNGATVEEGVTAEVLRADQTVTFVLTEPDFTTASRVAQAINSQVAPAIARARDANGIDILVPEPQRGQLVDFLARLENVQVAPDRRARVVINERTGTVVAGGDVRISSVSIAHGDLKISITVENSAVTQATPWLLSPPGSAAVSAWAGENAAAGTFGQPLANGLGTTVSNTRIEVD